MKKIIDSIFNRLRKKNHTRKQAIEILEIKRHLDITYKKGSKPYIRHFITHEEDPFEEQEILNQINWMKQVRTLPPVNNKNTELKPKFTDPITGEELKFDSNNNELLF